MFRQLGFASGEIGEEVVHIGFALRNERERPQRVADPCGILSADDLAGGVEKHEHPGAGGLLAHEDHIHLAALAVSAAERVAGARLDDLHRYADTHQRSSPSLARMASTRSSPVRQASSSPGRPAS
jgi:hypothetical protein